MVLNNGPILRAPGLINDGSEYSTPVDLPIKLKNGQEFRFYDTGDSHYVGLQAPALTASQIWTLPTADGTNAQVLVTDGSGVLSWASSSTTGNMADGTEGSPGLPFDDDTNTGIWSSAADTLNISTAGTERFEKDASGANFTVDLVLPATKKLYLDGGGDTYLEESSPDKVDLVVGGAVLLTAAVGKSTLNINGGDVDFGVKSQNNANALVVDAALDKVGILRAVQNDNTISVGGATRVVTATQDGQHLGVATSLTEAASGTHSRLSGTHFDALALTGGAGATTDAATVSIGGAPSGATNNYAFLVDAGLSRFDGDGTDVFELPADATDPTSGGGAATGRIPVKIGGSTVYLPYY